MKNGTLVKYTFHLKKQKILVLKFDDDDEDEDIMAEVINRNTDLFEFERILTVST